MGQLAISKYLVWNSGLEKVYHLLSSLAMFFGPEFSYRQNIANLGTNDLGEHKIV